MSDRRRRLLDAAIRVLGTRGLRQLTHRAVDAEAGLPLGSTSNSFRTREALVHGALDRLVERETELWGRLAAPADPGMIRPEDFVVAVTRLIGELTGPSREVTLARYAIFHEAAFDTGLQQKIAENRERLAAWGVPIVAALGSAHPARDYRFLLDVVDGMLLNQLAGPTPDHDPAAAIRLALAAVVHGDAP
ncbi:MAG: TetR family transcriptional regulator [Hamadaea sp.]|nr:TetR family transcriptional regulator [Hamadaea sp.]